MENKIVIYSFSPTAMQIAKTLQQKNYHIVVVDTEKENLFKAQKLGFETIQMSLMEDENIHSLKLSDKNIKAFFCLSDNKNTNLFIILSVRNIVKTIPIISISFYNEDNKALILAGANKIINPYEIGALRIFRLLHKPYILDVLDNILFSESNIEIAEITLSENSQFNGTYLKEFHLLEKYNIIPLGIQDKEINDNFIFYSHGINHKLDSGDTLVLLGKSTDLKSIKSLLNDYKK